MSSFAAHTSCLRISFMQFTTRIVALFLAILGPAFAVAADWPAYKNNHLRSSVSNETLTFPMRAGWTWHSAQPPAPAWPEPGRAMNSLDFDYAFQPVAADGLIFFGSSADDTLRGVDAASGTVVWSYTTGGPIRFAPQIADGKCYVASDDGHVYCLEARTGAEIWRFRAALNERQVLAHGRMVSRWPCRSGVLVQEGIVYLTAGMWPSEGVFVYALEAKTGKPIWCNDTSSYEYIEYPHMPSTSFGGPAPQGSLLSANGVLVVPTGRCAPAGYDAKTGKLLYFDSAPSNRGGTWATIFGGIIFTSAVAWQPDQSFRLGESLPQRADSLAALKINNGKEEWPLTKAIAEFTDEVKGPRWRSQIASGLFGRQRVIFAEKRIYAAGNGKVDAFEIDGDKVVRRLWSVEHPRVYSEALTNNALLLGGTDTIVALDLNSGRTLWQAEVDGQARGLAVADGRVIVSTHLGTIHVFGQTNAMVERKEVSKLAEPIPDQVTQILKRLTGGGSIKGFVVVSGDADAQFAEKLARHSRLHVLCLLSDGERVTTERRRLVNETALYGSRLAIVHTLKDRLLPLIPYFANLVVFAGNGPSGEELYRILRPCGGVMAFIGKFDVDALAKDARVPAHEVKSDAKEKWIIRGKLPGAFDWNSENDADKRVRWPLEFQWFGEPNGQLLVPRHARPRTPIPANGRLFVFGESHITAVDAYNGNELWRRRFNQGVCTGQSAVSADDDFVYVQDGKAFFQFEAATGKLSKVLGQTRGPLVLDGRKPIHREELGRSGDSGAIDIEATDEALRITLTANAASFSRNDVWELAFDFRSAEQRLLAASPGAFEIVLGAMNASPRAHKTLPLPPMKIESKRTDNSSVIVLTIPWRGIANGERPKDFTFAADLKLWTEDFRSKLWARPLVGKERFLNEAESVIALEGPQPRKDKVLSPHWPAPVSESYDLPDFARKPGRLPPLTLHRPDGDYSADFKEGMGKTDSGKDGPLKRIQGFELLNRQQPLTGEDVSREYSRSYGCSGTSCSAAMDFFRSGTIGMYDRLEDSGMRNISGIRSGCGLSLIPAFGMMVYSESASDCLCAYSFATSLGLVPSDRQRNEDWAMFDDNHLSQGLIRRSALNLGAPGDRRDAHGVLWFGFPRQPVAISKGVAMPLPYLLEVAEGFGAYRINTDRRPIENTDQPWIYGSGIKGLNRLRMDLTFHQPEKMILSLPTSAAPAIDGNLNDDCWDGFGAMTIHDRAATVQFRTDGTNLYVAYQETARRDLLGRKLPWKGKQVGKDCDFEKDDHFRLSLHNADATKIVTFAVTAGGGRYDAILSLGKDSMKSKTLPNPPDDATWNGSWTSQVKTTEQFFQGEFAIPWKTLEDAGIQKEKLVFECQKKGAWGGARDRALSRFRESAIEVQPFDRPIKSRNFIVRLHFAELEDVAAGERIFDVELQGRTVIESFDVVKEAGGRFRALVREFEISANRQMNIRLVPKAKSLTERSAPILSGVEVFAK